MKYNVLIERIQVDKKLNPRFGDRLACREIYKQFLEGETNRDDFQHGTRVKSEAHFRTKKINLCDFSTPFRSSLCLPALSSHENAAVMQVSVTKWIEQG